MLVISLLWYCELFIFFFSFFPIVILWNLSNIQWSWKNYTGTLIIYMLKHKYYYAILWVLTKVYTCVIQTLSEYRILPSLSEVPFMPFLVSSPQVNHLSNQVVKVKTSSDFFHHRLILLVYMIFVIILHILFCVLLPLLSIMFLRITHVFVSVISFYYLIVELFYCMHIPQFWCLILLLFEFFLGC